MGSKEPCIDCPDKVIDEYGYFCAVTCDKRAAWINHMAGIKEVVEWLRINERDMYASLMDWSIWQVKLKEWGIEK